MNNCYGILRKNTYYLYFTKKLSSINSPLFTANPKTQQKTVILIIKIVIILVFLEY